MKNFFLIICLCFLSFSAFSQTEKGSFLIGGSGNASIPNFKNYQYNLNVSPTAGYFVCNNFALGISPSGSYRHSFNTGIFREWSSNMGIGPLVRYYIGKSKLRFFANGGINYSHASYVTKYFDGRPDDNFTQHYNTFNEHVGIGIVYFINNFIGLEASLQYQHTHLKYYIPTSGIISGSGIWFNLGFQIYIPAKKKESVEQK